MSHAVRLVDPEPPGTATRQEFEAETALADAGLGDDAHHLSVARLGAGERRFQGMQIRVPAHEARESARSRHLEAGAKRSNAHEHEDPHRRLHPFHGERSQILQLEEAGDQLRRVLGQVDLSGLRELLHPCGEPDRVALRGVVHAQVVSDRPDHHLAGVEPHPDREVETARQPELVGVASQGVAQVEGGVAGPLGVILECDRRAEESHHAVAGVVGHRPLEAMHAVGEERREALHDVVEDFGIDLLGEIH